MRAPGRANLIGEHVDYNEGLVLPAALDLAVHVTGERTPDGIMLRSRQEAGEVAVDPATGAGPERGWGRYATAVVRALLDASLTPLGLDAVVDSSLPRGAGLGSSAALEVGLALAVLDEPPGAFDLARICLDAERRYVGLDCGIMDQLVCTAGVAGHALCIDCRDETYEPVPLPADLAIVVVHSGVDRSLTEGVYNRRHAECRAAAEVLGVASLRDATPAMVAARREALGPVLSRRARHVVTETERVPLAVEALRRGRGEELGALFAASHESLAADYEVSTPELDTLVEIAAATPGVVAARLTGAGLGGCTVNLIERAQAEAAASAILRRYEGRTGPRGRFWICRASAGATRGAASRP